MRYIVKNTSACSIMWCTSVQCLSDSRICFVKRHQTSDHVRVPQTPSSIKIAIGIEKLLGITRFTRNLSSQYRWPYTFVRRSFSCSWRIQIPFKYLILFSVAHMISTSKPIAICFTKPWWSSGLATDKWKDAYAEPKKHACWISCSIHIWKHIN